MDKSLFVAQANAMERHRPPEDPAGGGTMWIVIAVPWMLLGVAITVVPLVQGSFHHHGVEQRTPGRAVVGDARATWRSADLAAVRLGVNCPVCSAGVAATSKERLVGRLAAACLEEPR